MGRLREFLKRITAVSTPIGGISWSPPPEGEKGKARSADEASERQQVTLGDLQIDYLLEISKPRNEGSIYGGIDERTGRDVAPYQEAIELFQEYDLMRYSVSGYKLSPKGWKLADELWALKILDALDFNDFMDHKDLAEAVGLTDGQTELEELKRHVDALEKDGLVRVNRTMHHWTVRVLEEGVTQRKHRRIEL
ncbi:MAG: winged helix-turn-helix domain-containing protein [Planctomycetes bacterium]|nr:winged helix-turn-helix domain-containing protein [Planctomycetota bacterium]